MKSTVVLYNRRYSSESPFVTISKRQRQQRTLSNEEIFSLDHANEASAAVKHETQEGSAVIVP
jgi:hypothetical protein